MGLRDNEHYNEYHKNRAYLSRIRQDAQLKYMQYDEEEAKKRFIAVVESGAIEKKWDKLTFTIREPLLRQYFEEWVAKEKGFTDTSFNKNLVTLSSETFCRVLDSLAVEDFPTDKIKENIEKLEQIELQQDNLTKENLKRLFVEQLVKSAGRETGAWTVKTLASTLSLMILGM